MHSVLWLSRECRDLNPVGSSNDVSGLQVETQISGLEVLTAVVKDSAILWDIFVYLCGPFSINSLWRNIWIPSSGSKSLARSGCLIRL
jgi:hypothetical protein